MEIFINLPFVEETSYLLPIFSTSLVGSTPGNNTKKIGTRQELSSKTSFMLNAGCSIYYSPIASFTNVPRAEVVLSGLRALKSKSFWNFVKSFRVLGKSIDSAFSSLYHFFHYKRSDSRDWQRGANAGIGSSPLHAAHA